MIELVLVYCLLDAPDRCVEKREELDASKNAIQCTIEAQTYAQTYVREHPKYELKGWRCEVDHPKESPA